MTLRRVLVIGSGGREHALAWRLGHDPEPPEVLLAPGSAAMTGAFHRVAVEENDPSAVAALARRERVDLVVVGPEGPLAAGVVDALAAAGVPAFGPTRAAAAIESSKSFAKEVMQAAGIPTARAELHHEPGAARAALARFGPRWVIKADGLAGGKGVCVTAERAVAEEFVVACLERGRFGDAGRRVLLEECLEGEEVSVMAVTDGRVFVTLPVARDYKRARDGEAGPNTGGMGALAPAPAVDAALAAEIGERVLRPLLAELERRGAPFRGALYAGLMLTRSGPRVLEFNARFGDPETQVVLPLIEGRFAELLAGAARGTLDPAAIARTPGAAVAVTLADEGYPEAVAGTGWITGLEQAARAPGVRVFGAAGAPEPRGLRVLGGRAAYVVGQDAALAPARARAYAAIEQLGGSGWRCRRDIGAPGSYAVAVPGAGQREGRIPGGAR